MIKKTPLSLKEQVLLFKQLSFLMKSGMPLEDCILELSGHISKKKKNVIRKIAAQVAGGKQLSQSLTDYCSGLSSGTIALITVGEQTGTLANNVRILSEDLAKRIALRKKIVSAITYPLCIAIIAIGLCGFLTLFIFPKIRPLFTSMAITLPLSTRILIGITDGIEKYGWFMLIGIIISVFILLFLWRRASIRILINHLEWHIPLLNSLLKNYFLMSVMRTTGMVIAAGISVHEAFRIQAEQQSIHQKTLNTIEKRNQRGEKISVSLLAYPKLFPSITIQLISAGEMSGSLPETFLYLSQYFEDELESALKTLSGLIEPVLLLGMGLCVGFIALSMILPIYGLSQAISTAH